MVLDQVAGGWHLTIRLDGARTHEACLQVTSLAQAVVAAERIYSDLRGLPSDRPMCWQCVHWLPVQASCYFGWPEARQTGGRFAAQCSVFKACPTRK